MACVIDMNEVENWYLKNGMTDELIELTRSSSKGP